MQINDQQELGLLTSKQQQPLYGIVQSYSPGGANKCMYPRKLGVMVQSSVYKAGPHSILDWLLHPDVRYCQSSASPISYPLSVERTTTLLQQIWTSGYLRCRSKGLEPSTQPSSRYIAQLRLLQVST